MTLDGERAQELDDLATRVGEALEPVTVAATPAEVITRHMDGLNRHAIVPSPAAFAALVDAVMPIFEAEAASWTGVLEGMEARLAEWIGRAQQAEAAIAEVRRLQEMTIAASCRAYAIEQAEDTLAVLKRVLGPPENQPKGDAVNLDGERAQGPGDLRVVVSEAVWTLCPSHSDETTCKACRLKINAVVAVVQPELDRLEDHNVDLLDKLDGEKSCACSWDDPGDVCVAHSPPLKKALQRAEQAERERDEARECLEIRRRDCDDLAEESHGRLQRALKAERERDAALDALADLKRYAEQDAATIERVRELANTWQSDPLRMRAARELTNAITGTPPTLGARVRTLRLSAGLTLGQLGSRVGLTRESIHRIEADKQTPRELTLAALADALGVERAVLDRPGDLIESYPPGSHFARSGAQDLFRRMLLDQPDGPHPRETQ